MSDLSRLLGFYDHKTARHNAFMVAQANIYCTQALIRYVNRFSTFALPHYSDGISLVCRYYIFRCRSSLIKTSGIRLMPDPRYASETLESICHDLLHVLRSIPIECIAANGKPLTAKGRYRSSSLVQPAKTFSWVLVRYIVSGLLDPEANDGRILINPHAWVTTKTTPS